MAAKKRSARWWRKLTEEWEMVRGQVSARAFAESRGVNPQTFSWWRYELRRRDREMSTALVPVELVDHVQEGRTVIPASERWLEAELPDGVKVRFAEGTGVEYVAALVLRVGRGGRC